MVLGQHERRQGPTPWRSTTSTTWPTIPSTARHIATKLCERFVSDAPPAGLVHQAREDLPRERHGDRAGAARAVPLARPSRIRSGAKVRRPMRGRRGHRSGSSGIQPGRRYGHATACRACTGWSRTWATRRWRGRSRTATPTTADAWRSAGGTLGRWNTPHVRSRRTGGPTNLPLPEAAVNLLPKPLPKTYGALVDALAQRLVFRTLAPSHRNAVLGFLGKAAGDPLKADRRGRDAGGCPTWWR